MEGLIFVRAHFAGGCHVFGSVDAVPEFLLHLEEVVLLALIRALQQLSE